MKKSPLQTLKDHFGYTSFLPDQEEVIDIVLSGKDALAVMPTGSGKSIIYQVPALIYTGLTLVISPLIALMKDQVEALKVNGIPAAYINSMLTASESQEIMERVDNKDIKLLYVAPETLFSGSFFSFISKQDLSLFAVDEAHCISAWGHDFRPVYKKLNTLKEKFPEIPMIALTATADKVTREDIIRQLNLPDPEIIVASFNRANLSLSVLPGIDRFNIILDFIKDESQSSGIIYCLSRKSTEEVSAKLNAVGVKSVFYHAGMERKEREQAQEKFIKDEVPVVCATIAFGMGIDKSNVRWIIHYNMPKSIENYYQEIGRAGRDGIDSKTLMFYSFRDVVLLRQFAEDSGQPEIQLNKLQRMQQYAEATSCRRKILLSYFNEHKEENCNNCDVCHEPPKTFDGTVLAQKALSAIFRLKEQVASGLLIDVLKGSGKREIFERGYNEIKTYGAGRDLGFLDWQQYLLQMLHLGLFDIAYNDGQKLKISEIGHKVLFENKKIDLVKASYGKDRYKEKKKRVKKLTKKEKMKFELSSILKDLRKEFANQEKVPAYVIFNDKTLDELAEKRPSSKDEILDISGISSFKLKKYGEEILQKIIDFRIENKDKGSTYLFTKKLLDEGNNIQQIADTRELNLLTIIGHLTTLYEKDSAFDIFPHIPKFEIEELLKYIKNGKPDLSHKDVFDHFRAKFEYYQIGIAFVVHSRE